MQTAAPSDARAPHEMALRSLHDDDPERAAPLLDQIRRDPLVAHHAFVCRGSPQLLRLLADSVAARAVHVPRGRPPSSAVLIARAAKAMARWSAAGFREAPAEQIERRWSACTACPHLGAPPARVLYQLTRGGADDRICGLCGCTASRKVRMLTERCPDRLAADPALTRWGEPAAA
jgi:hypothetical protein